MNDNESKAWHQELMELYKIPDIDNYECCKCVFFGLFNKLRADVHTDYFHGSFELSINFCPHCGRNMLEFREMAKKIISETKI